MHQIDTMDDRIDYITKRMMIAYFIVCITLPILVLAVLSDVRASLLNHLSAHLLPVGLMLASLVMLLSLGWRRIILNYRHNIRNMPSYLEWMAYAGLVLSIAWIFIVL